MKSHTRSSDSPTHGSITYRDRSQVDVLEDRGCLVQVHLLTLRGFDGRAHAVVKQVSAVHLAVLHTNTHTHTCARCLI